MFLPLVYAVACASSPAVSSDLIGLWITNDGSQVVFKEGDDGVVRFEQDGIVGSLSVEKHTLPAGAEGFKPDFTAQLKKEEGGVELGRLWVRVNGDEMESLFEGGQTVHRNSAVRRGAKAKSAGAGEDKSARRGEVVALHSGVQYKVLREGSGRQHPSDGCAVEFNFLARTAQAHFEGGGAYDDTFQRGEPAEIVIGGRGVLPGLDEALRIMVQGDVWEILIPPSMGYSDLLGGYDHVQHPQAPGWIYRAKVPLVLKVEVLKVGEECKGPAAKRCWPDSLDGCDGYETAFIQEHKGNANEELRRLLGVLRGPQEEKPLAEETDLYHRRVAILRRLGAEEPVEEEGKDCDAASEGCGTTTEGGSTTGSDEL
eukprot:Hpha_TRINITY_DN16678_c2_g4::TRINITY_DN16678_c2_g4_i1::g.183892::m.183892